MRKCLFTALGLITVLSSCTKDQTETQSPATLKASDFLPTEKGNYWVYQLYHQDSLGNYHPSDVTDSAFVVGDSSLNGKLYTVFTSHNKPYKRLRRADDLHIYNGKDSIIFSVDQSLDTIGHYVQAYPGNTNDTLHYGSLTMTHEDVNSELPAGNFTTREVAHHFIAPFPDDTVTGTVHFGYSKDVGMVFYESRYLRVEYPVMEYRLLRYNLE